MKTLHTYPVSSISLHHDCWANYCTLTVNGMYYGVVTLEEGEEMIETYSKGNLVPSIHDKKETTP